MFQVFSRASGVLEVRSLKDRVTVTPAGAAKIVTLRVVDPAFFREVPLEGDGDEIVEFFLHFGGVKEITLESGPAVKTAPLEKVMRLAWYCQTRARIVRFRNFDVRRQGGRPLLRKWMPHAQLYFDGCTLDGAKNESAFRLTEERWAGTMLHHSSLDEEEISPETTLDATKLEDLGVTVNGDEEGPIRVTNVRTSNPALACALHENRGNPRVFQIVVESAASFFKPESVLFAQQFATAEALVFEAAHESDEVRWDQVELLAASLTAPYFVKFAKFKIVGMPANMSGMRLGPQHRYAPMLLMEGARVDRANMMLVDPYNKRLIELRRAPPPPNDRFYAFALMPPTTARKAPTLVFARAPKIAKLQIPENAQVEPPH